MPVTDLLTRITDAESVTNWNQGNISTDDDPIQGNGAIGLKNSASTADLFFDFGSTLDITDQFLYVWCLSKTRLDTQANGGIGIIAGTDSSNYGIWFVGGSDNYRGGWQRYAVKCNLTKNPFDTSVGTPPSDMTAIQIFGARFVNTASIMGNFNNINIDAIDVGTGLLISSDNAGQPWTFQDILDEDTQNLNQWGILRKTGGIFLVQGQLVFEDAVFDDEGQTIVFENHPNTAGEDFFVDSDFGFEVRGTGDFKLGNRIGDLGLEGVNVFSATDTTNPPRHFMSFNDPKISGLNLYGMSVNHADEIQFGSSGVVLTGTDIDILDCAFVDTNVITQNITGAEDISSNRIISNIHNTGAFFYAESLAEPPAISANQWALINSSGWFSTDDGVFQTITIKNHDFASYGRYIHAFENKNWIALNPINFSIDTANQNKLTFETEGNAVQESYEVELNASDGSGATMYIYEGSVISGIVNSGELDNNGFRNEVVNKNKYTDNGAGGLNLVSRDNFALRSYNYTFSPLIRSLTLNQKLELNEVFVTDSAITETDQSQAITNGNGTQVFKHGTDSNINDPNPLVVIHFNSGNNTLSIGDQIVGSTSNAAGVLVENIGDSTDGFAVMSGWNNILFQDEEDLTAGTWTASADIVGGDQSFQENYTWHIACSGLDLTVVYDYLMAKFAESPIDDVFRSGILWGEDEQSQFLYLGSNGYFTDRNINLAEGVWASNRAVGTVEKFTSDDGTEFFPPVQVSFTLTSLQTNSEVQICDATTNTVIASTESSSTSFTHNYIYGGSDTDIFVIVHHLDFNWLKISNLSLTNTNQSIPINQIPDRNYSNPV